VKPLFKPYFLAGKTEKATISLFRLGRALKTRAVKAAKKINVQRAFVCQFMMLAKG